jgi:hypothetical protein
VRDLIEVRVGKEHVDEPHVDVRRDEGSRPDQFVWRGRLYVVRGVLAHWVEVGAWWHSRLPDGLPARVDEHGREVWRVEALAGRAGTPGVYDLAYDEAAASWTLARSHD